LSRERDARARVALRCGPAAIEVLSQDAASLAWLAEFLAPAFGRTPTRRPHHRVFFDVAPARYAALQRRLRSAPTREIEGFGFDGHFSRHASFGDEEGRTWAYDPAGAFIGVDEAAREILVVARRDAPRARLALMRVVRELAVSAQLRAGLLPVHGAAFAARGGAVLICGPKRAGKSSLLVHALTCGGAFLSNDRVFVDASARPRATPMPTIVMLREGTLSLFPSLRRDFERARYDRSRTLAECAPGVARRTPRARPGFDRPGISPAQLCDLLGAPMRAAAPVRALLFPRIDPRARGLALHRLAPARARSRLARPLMKPSHPMRLAALFSPARRRESVPATAERDACHQLASRVPAFECRLGPQAYETDLLAALKSVLD
jgi:hypothetical protein